MYTLGADPEVFLRNNTGVKSVIGKIGGTKEYPRPLVQLGEGFAVQEDNVALEFNIPPSASKADFVKNIALATGYLEQLVKDMHGLTFDNRSAVSFPQEEMEDDAAFVFGCDPDFNAWSGGARNPKPRATDQLLRSCGGHVHIGSAGVNPIDATKRLDLFLAVPSTIMDKGLLRKQLYGKAGAFRPKPYGMEYRVLSNYWIFDPKLTSWVHDQVGRALESDINPDEDREAILAAVNDGDMNAVNMLVNKHNLEVLNA